MMKAIFPDAQYFTIAAYQRRLVQEMAGELLEFSRELGGPEGGVLKWMAVRFQVENLKVILRVIATGRSSDTLEGHLLALPEELDLKQEALIGAKTLQRFAALIPELTFRDALQKAIENYGENIPPFVPEGVLDRTYFHELLKRIDRLHGEEKQLSRALAQQEADIFHLMLVVRGRFTFDLEPRLLEPLHVSGTAISRAVFGKMLTTMDLGTVLTWARGRVMQTVVNGLASEKKDEGQNTASVEALAWTRFLHLANRAFRRSHMGIAAIIGYFGIRRIEVANLITLSEGIRNGLPAAPIRARLIPREKSELANV
jgi:V/A-type H+-transporting ATPase subunit C